MVKTKIFFIHGWGFDHDFWRPLIYELKKLKLDMQFSFYLFNLGFLDNEEKLKLSLLDKLCKIFLSKMIFLFKRLIFRNFLVNLIFLLDCFTV